MQGAKSGARTAGWGVLFPHGGTPHSGQRGVRLRNSYLSQQSFRDQRRRNLTSSGGALQAADRPPKFEARPRCQPVTTACLCMFVF
jgi:hypothetical protein